MQSKRRTKTAMKSTNPKWNQTFVYPCRPQKVREIVLWFYFGFVQSITSIGTFMLLTMRLSLLYLTVQ